MQTWRKREREKERKRGGRVGSPRRMNDRATRKENQFSLARSCFHDNPISLRRFSIFTTSFEPAANSVAKGNPKYSRNLGFTLAAHEESGGKDVHPKEKDSFAVTKQHPNNRLLINLYFDYSKVWKNGVFLLLSNRKAQKIFEENVIL